MLPPASPGWSVRAPKSAMSGAIVSGTAAPTVWRRCAKPNGSVETTASGPIWRMPRRSAVAVYSRVTAGPPCRMPECVCGKTPPESPLTPSGSRSCQRPCPAGSGERMSTRIRTSTSCPTVAMSGENARETRSVLRTKYSVAMLAPTPSASSSDRYSSSGMPN